MRNKHQFKPTLENELRCECGEPITDDRHIRQPIPVEPPKPRSYHVPRFYGVDYGTAG